MKLVVRWGAFGLVLVALALFGQNPAIQRTVVHKAAVSVPGREAVIARVEVAPGAPLLARPASEQGHRSPPCQPRNEPPLRRSSAHARFSAA